MQFGAICYEVSSSDALKRESNRESGIGLRVSTDFLVIFLIYVFILLTYLLVFLIDFLVSNLLESKEVFLRLQPTLSWVKPCYLLSSL